MLDFLSCSVDRACAPAPIYKAEDESQAQTGVNFRVVCYTNHCVFCSFFFVNLCDCFSSVPLLGKRISSVSEMLLLVLLSAMVLPSQVITANFKRPILDIDNSLETNGITPRHTGARKFLHLTFSPPKTLTHSGGILKLRCDAVASPAPSVTWLKNDVPIVDYDMDTNEILDHSLTGLGSVVSTLILGKPSENSEDIYTCLIQSGQNTSRASTLVYTLDFNNDMSERYRLMPTKPQIVVYYKVLMDILGSTVVLPCKAKGHPRPEVFWKDSDNNIISKRNQRMKVLRSGELVISKLLWTDMGEFTCISKNVFGKEMITTFVYPVKAS